MDSNEMLQKMISNLPEKTGKTLEEWLKILKSKSFAKHSEAVNFLKNEYGVSHGFANTIVHLSKDNNDSDDDLLKAQYVGKESLEPIYQSLKKEISSFGKDIEFAVKKTYVSVRRKKQFAIIQPSTKSRMDLGLNIKNQEASGVLENSGSFNAMCSHRIRLENASDVNSDCKKYLKQAYDQAG